MPPFVVITTIILLVLAFFTFIFNIIGWPKVKPSDMKRFIMVRGRSIAWNVYLVVAILFTIYFLLMLSIWISYLPFTITLVTLIVLIIWALVGVWSPTILKYYEDKRVSVGLQVASYSLITLTVILFWFVEYPEIQTPLFVTLLLIAVFVILIVHSVYNRIKAARAQKR